MILHIPHSSKVIPEDLRDQIVLSDDDLTVELLRVTDTFTDEFFALPGATMLRFPISRLLVDVERFRDDAEEPMSKKGMGMIYTLTAMGKSSSGHSNYRKKIFLYPNITTLTIKHS
jgi:N-formylglutamate deformylase